MCYRYYVVTIWYFSGGTVIIVLGTLQRATVINLYLVFIFHSFSVLDVYTNWKHSVLLFKKNEELNCFLQNLLSEECYMGPLLSFSLADYINHGI